MNAVNINQDKLMSLVGMAMSELSGANGGVMISVGNKLGLYKAMAGRGPMFPAELAKRAGCAERYVREWLNCNAAGGYVTYHPETQQYELSPEQAMMLADDTSPVFIPNAWEVTASMWFDEAKTIEAFRTGKGIAWGDHHERLYCGVAAFFRNAAFARWQPDASRWPRAAGLVARVLALEPFARLVPFEEKMIRTPIPRHREVLAELGAPLSARSHGTAKPRRGVMRI